MNWQPYRTLAQDPGLPSRGDHARVYPTAEPERTQWTQIIIAILLALILAVLTVIAIMLILFFNLAVRNEPGFQSLVESFGPIGDISRTASPFVDFVSRGAEGVTFNATSVMENALPKEQAEVEAFMRALVNNANGALGLMGAAYDQDLVGRVGAAMDHPAVGSAASLVDWVRNRTEDGSVDSGAAFVKTTIQYGMNFTADESQAFAAIEQVATTAAPLVHNINELLRTLTEAQESVLFSELSRRFYVILDQFTEGKRMTQIVENSHTIYSGLAHIVDYVSSDEMRERLNIVLGLFPEIADTVVKIGDAFRDDGLSLRFGDRPRAKNSTVTVQ
jgi:hypothetical protein